MKDTKNLLSSLRSERAAYQLHKMRALALGVARAAEGIDIFLLNAATVSSRVDVSALPGS